MPLDLQAAHRRLIGDDLELGSLVRPSPAVELIQRDATPAQVDVAFAMLELHVHHNCARLLNAPNFAELDVIAESGGEFGTGSIGAQVSGRKSRQQEKQYNGECCDAAHDQEAVQREPASDLPREVTLIGNVPAMDGFDHGTANFHGDECVDREQKEDGEDGEEAAADRQHRSRKHSQERKHGEVDVVPRFLDGEELDHQAEKNKVNGGCNVASGNQEEIAEEDQHVEDGEVIGPAVRDLQVTVAHQEVSAKNESACNEKRRRPVEASGPGEGCKSGDDEKKKRDLKISFERRSKRRVQRGKRQRLWSCQCARFAKALQHLAIVRHSGGEEKGACHTRGQRRFARIKSRASVPRDAIPPTPPGPEGSNGNGLVRVQWGSRCSACL